MALVLYLLVHITAQVITDGKEASSHYRKAEQSARFPLFDGH